MENDLEQLRDQVNKIDSQILDLINQRAETALDIGKAKAAIGKKVYDPKRERVVIEQLDMLNRGPLEKGAVEDIFNSIITACREIQSKQR